MVSETMARRGTASMAKMMGLLCVADSKLGKLTDGQFPVTRTGDYSDVVVVDGDGRIIPWQRAARVDDTEMGQAMREVVDKLYTFLWNFEEPELAALRRHREGETSGWPGPKEDPGLKKQIEVLASGIVEGGGRPGATKGATTD